MWVNFCCVYRGMSVPEARSISVVYRVLRWNYVLEGSA